MASARRATSASSRPAHSTCATENVRVDGSRPASSHAARTVATRPSTSAGAGNDWLNSVAYRAASAGVRFGPLPPTMIGTRDCTGLGSAGECFSW